MSGLERLVAIMARLRDPEGGCPWDLAQDFASIAPYTLEEAYEVDDAIRRGDLEALRDELGDLLFQVAFHARMAEEAGHFAIGDVVDAICEKMERRHPHVFSGAAAGSPAEQARSWEAIKQEERAARGASSEDALADVPVALPALARAAKLLRRAERAGLPAGSLAPEAGAHGARELGDRLLALAAEANRQGVDPEQALRDANARFLERVREGKDEP